LDFDEFVEAWPKVSDELFKTVTKETFAEDSDAVKKEKLSKFSRFLFVASLRETTTRNALELVKTGNRAIIIYGPPGTSKTYESERVAVALIKEYERDKPISSLSSNVNGESLSGEDTDKENFEDEWRKTHNFTNLLTPQNKHESDTYKLEPNRGYYQIVQFHPSYCYQDFVGGIIPEIEGSKGLVYKLQSGIFKCFCDAARQAANEDNPPPFVLVIDEINRADLSSVFGELLYALEYRDKPIQIPHFGEFLIPSNVYIIGTMNNVDKSLVTFDLALRRRFGFLKLMPDMNVLRSWNKQRIDEDMLEDYIAHCSQLNEALCFQNDKGGLALQNDYQIGHAYFMKIADFCVSQDTNIQENASGGSLKITSFALERLWEYHIEPLLEEYLGVMFEETKDTRQTLKDNFCKELEQKE
jgi:5-methylcytosine-specific restriction endonuclease McrBC GTP-binding regulatory subunit McrB